MNRRWMRIAIGVFVALALVLLGTLIVLFNSLPRLFQADHDVHGPVHGRRERPEPGAPVRRSGVRDRHGRRHRAGRRRPARSASIWCWTKPYVVRKNEQVTLVASLLGGDAAIDLVTMPPPEGQAPDTTPVPPEEVLPGVRAGNVSQLVARASDVVPTTQETLNDIRKSMQRIEKMTPLVEDTFREYRDLGHKLNDAMPDLRQTNDDIDKLAQSATKVMDQAQDAVPRITRDADDAAAAARACRSSASATNLSPAEPGPDHPVGDAPQRGADAHGHAAQRRQRPERDGGHPQHAQRQRDVPRPRPQRQRVA